VRSAIRRLRDRLRYLDLRLKGSKEVAVRVIERPGCWMSAAECQALVEEMRDVTRRGIGTELDYGVLSGDAERLRNSVVTLLYDKASGKAIAFNALALMPIELRGRPAEVVHLGLVMVDPGYRTKGLSWVLYGLTCMLIFFRRGLRPLWISNVTQVPAIIGKVAEVFVTAYPNPFDTTRRSFEHLSVAREIMAAHRHIFGVGAEAGFDEGRFVITNAYTGGSDNLKKTFVQAQKHRDGRANELCERELDYQRGDDFLQIAKLDMSSVRYYLLREVPSASLLALLYQIGFLLAAQVLLPVLHWLTPSVTFGELRARRPV
jgi:GNAT superfamily N-acetyltransferase